MQQISLNLNNIDVFPQLTEKEQNQIRRILEKYSGNREKLILKSISEIEALECVNFYIASYQRGYRWGKDEIEALLNDIYAVKESGGENDYCMQPLVVKCVTNKMAFPLDTLTSPLETKPSSVNLEICYELIDGQQRLTTLFLILNTFSEYTNEKNDKPNYKIYYELDRAIDKEFLNNAKEIIENWIKENYYITKYKKLVSFNPKFIPDIQNLCRIIRSRLKFIWNEIEPDAKDAPEKVFRKINKGKIPLTNAELFKAMLLNCPDSANDARKREIEKIAFEWDKIERELRNDDFWYFISNDTSDKRTRIDYLLDIYASRLADSLEKAQQYDANKERYSFLVVSAYLKNRKKENPTEDEGEEIRSAWQQIVDLYEQIRSWYNDSELYHFIGFLVACKGKRTDTIELMKTLYRKNTTINESADGKKFATKKDMRNFVKNACSVVILYGVKVLNLCEGNLKSDNNAEERSIENYDYGKDDVDKNDILNFLLYSNICEYLKYTGAEVEGKAQSQPCESIRFPFRLYKKMTWDIEHINPQTPETDWKKTLNPDRVDKDREKKLIVAWLNEKEAKDGVGELTSDEAINEAWKKYTPDAGSGEISNLILLNSSINRAYHNALFIQKRSKIIEQDKNGVFIPPVTRNVFLKYFTDTPDNLIEWSADDQEKYKDSLKMLFDECERRLKANDEQNN